MDPANKVGTEKATATHGRGGAEEQSRPSDKGPPPRPGRNARRRRHKNQSGADGSGNGNGKKEALESPQKDLRAKFYEHYHKRVEEYSTESVLKCRRNLVPVVFYTVATLVITAPFGLLRPNDPRLQWAAPPHIVIQVQAILYTSFAISLFALSLLMPVVLWWLQECASVDTREPSMERSQNRQWKLDRINHVMESLPWMSHTTSLLQFYALSRYLLETYPTIASIVIVIALPGAIVNLYTVIVGVVLPIWSYRIPVAYSPHHHVYISSYVLDLVFATPVERSTYRHLLSMVWDGLVENYHSNLYFREPGVIIMFSHILLLPICLLADASRLWVAIIRPFTSFTRRAYFWLRQGPEQRAGMLDLYCISWTLWTPLDIPTRLAALNYLVTMTEAHFDPTLVIYCFDTLIDCVKVTHGKVTVTQELEQLATVSALCCLHALSHLTITDAVLNVEDIRQRYTKTFPPEVNFGDLPFSHTLGVIHTVFYQTGKFRVGFPTGMDQITIITWRSQLPRRNHWWEDGKPSNEERSVVARALGGWARPPWRVQWEDYKPSGDEHVIVSRALAKLARFEYRRRGHRKVPRWLLRFAFHSLSQTPPPPTSVTTDCLSIIAIDLGCDLSNIRTPYESVQLDEISHLITHQLGTMAVETVGWLLPRCKAIGAILPFAARQEWPGGYVTLDALLHVLRTSEGFIWKRIIPALFNKTNPLTIVLVSPHVDWHLPFLADRGNLLTLWAAAASAVPYTDEVGRSVVDVLLHVSMISYLRSHIPAGIWGWLRKRPSLSPKCHGRRFGTEESVIRHIRALGDIEIIMSYLLLVCSEWDSPWSAFELCDLIREEFGGVEMKGHREDLIRHLDHILEQLDRGLEYLRQYKPRLRGDLFQEAKEGYRSIMEVLLEVHRGATRAHAQSYSALVYVSPPPPQPYLS